MTETCQKNFKTILGICASLALVIGIGIGVELNEDSPSKTQPNQSNAGDYQSVSSSLNSEVNP